MTLRARLTAAFLAVVLGPVMVGAVFVGITVGSVTRHQAVQQLDLGATTVRTTIDAQCRQLRAAAEMAAVLYDTVRTPQAIATVVRRELAAVVQLQNTRGQMVASTGVLPEPWADCAGPSTGEGDDPGKVAIRGGTGPARALAARVQLRDPRGVLIGYSVAAVPVDVSLIQRVSAAAGVNVTMLADDGESISTVEGDQGSIAGLARQLRGAGLRETEAGEYVRTVQPQTGQPLWLALSTDPSNSPALYAVLVAVVVIAGLLAIVAAWWLARSTTQPLAELSGAAERVAGGDLNARVPVRSRDEVGKLATTFNRMTRETQAYVAALTASRDQLRGNLGLLGDTLSSSHDQQRILEVLLQTAMAATGAQAGVVLLVDQESSYPAVLTGRCAAGLDGSGVPVERMRLRVGEGLLGAVAASGEPRRGRVDREGPRLSEHEPRCRTYIAVPFSGAGGNEDDEPNAQPAGGLLGVLALYDRLGQDDFDDADLVTLRTFAGQVAVAVDNVIAHEKVKRLSITDSLTGLWNYRHLRDSLRRETERAGRFDRLLCVLALDLDRFKDVNDNHGHPAGDAVLAAVGKRIKAEIREVDLAFRQGGEEFVALLPETDAAGGERVAERLCRAIRTMPVRLEPGYGTRVPPLIPITVSIGIAVYPDHGTSDQEVLEAADDALYAAKASGRDTWRVAGPTSARRGGALRGPVAGLPDLGAVGGNGPVRPDPDGVGPTPVADLPHPSGEPGDGGPPGAPEPGIDSPGGDGSPPAPGTPRATASGGAPQRPRPPRQTRGG